MKIWSNKFVMLAVILLISLGSGSLLSKIDGFPLVVSWKSSNGAVTTGFSASDQERRATRQELFAAFAPQTEFVMIGDSITHRGHWDAFFPDYRIANRGIGGDTAADVLGRMDAVLALRPRFAFLMLGINDLSRQVPIDDVVADYVKIVELLSANDVTPVIQSTLACRASTCGNRNNDIAALNKRLQQYAEVNGVMFVDINAVLSTPQGGLRDEMTNDGLHLNAFGYKNWVDVITPLFREFATSE